jgi:hypothetical protein
MTTVDYRTILLARNKAEINAAAKKLGIKNYSHMTKDELVESIVTTRSVTQIKRVVSPSLWTRYHNHVYGAASLIGLALAIWTLLPKKAKEGGSFDSNLNRPAIYQVHVIITDPNNQPVEDAELLSAPYESKRTDGGWQIDIPRSAVIKDNKLSIGATKDGGIYKGSTEYTLGNDYNPHITVKLYHDVSARIKGQVNDEDGNPLSGATVYVEGHLEEKVVTSEDGLFDLPAHAAPYEPVHLFVERAGYKPWNDEIPAGGSTLAKIVPTKK